MNANQCERYGKPDTNKGWLFGGKDEKEPSAWYCSKCSPIVETRAWVWESSWQADQYYYRCTEFPQYANFDEGELRWYERMDAMRLVWLDEYWTEED